MKIVFFPSSCLPFHARTLDERPLGGIETAVIRLSEELLRLGHDVVVLSQLDNPPLSEPLYLPQRAIRDLGSVDVLVAVRDWAPLFMPIEANLRFLWTGDSYDQPQCIGMGDKRIAARLDAVLGVSRWHCQTLAEKSGLSPAKFRVLKNGIKLSYFEGDEPRKRKRLIYSSTPYRGLALMPRIYRELVAKHREIELHVFSGYSVYSAGPGDRHPGEMELKRIKDELLKMPGVSFPGNVTQKQLAREFMRSSLLLYPNTFEETSCITALEAQAAGCAIVTSDLGALSETIGAAGILIGDPPGSEAYIREIVSAADKVLSDDKLFETLSRAGREQARAFDWSTTAADFVAMAESFQRRRIVNG